jgi:hypothetical protein
MYYDRKPYVSAAERRRTAARAVARLRKRGGDTVSPVVVDGRAIAGTFWGKAWCDNLKRYSDYSNRLPRGRTYVRNGSVIDLKIMPGEVTALVSGSSIYTVRAQIKAIPKARWQAISSDCAGSIDSLVELLNGRFSKGVMERMCRQESGLFPSPKEISFACSCPDWAAMCKHVAAVFYGIGARLDQSPELLFALRKVDPTALLADAGRELSSGAKRPGSGRVLAQAGLAEIFGIDLADSGAESPSPGPGWGKGAASPEAVKTKSAREVRTSPRRTSRPAPGKSSAGNSSRRSARSVLRPPRRHRD